MVAFKRRLALFAISLLAALSAGAPARAQEVLRVVNVSAPAINCIFNASCTVTVTDSVSDIPLPGTTATGRLQSRTFAAAPGSPAEGTTGYEYRVDLRHVTGVSPRACVASLWIFTGYPEARQYDGAGPLDNIFVVTRGGLGSIGVRSAIQEGEGTKITFTRPVCSGAGAGPGQSSYFFGFASVYPPRSFTSYVNTKVVSSPALTTVNVPARGPDYTQ